MNNEIQQNKMLIAQTEQRKRMLVKSVRIDLEQLEKKRHDRYCVIGEKIYVELRDNKIDSSIKDVISEDFDVIQRIQEDISVLNKKLEDIELRYEEELEMLKKLIPKEDFIKENNWMQEEKVCPKCKAKIQSDSLFCTSCGHKL